MVDGDELLTSGSQDEQHEKLVSRVNATASSDAILHVVSIPDAWSNIFAHGR